MRMERSSDTLIDIHMKAYKDTNMSITFAGKTNGFVYANSEELRDVTTRHAGPTTHFTLQIGDLWSNIQNHTLVFCLDRIQNALTFF